MWLGGCEVPLIRSGERYERSCSGLWTVNRILKTKPNKLDANYSLLLLHVDRMYTFLNFQYMVKKKKDIHNLKQQQKKNASKMTANNTKKNS